MTSGLTARQSDCLAFIEGYMAERAIAPSYEEIAAHLKTHKGNAARLVGCLERRGFLHRIKGQARSLRLIDQRIQCPQCGYHLQPGTRRAAESPESAAPGEPPWSRPVAFGARASLGGRR